MNSERRPRLRILHQAARTGGTVISRCLGAMETVVLLSEIHPAGTEIYNPLDQAADWYQLLTKADIEKAAAGATDFADAIELVRLRAEQRGQVLVIRDWSHLDFHGVPFTRPSGRSLLVEVLKDRYELRRFSTVRHPYDQWLSLARQQIIRGRLDAVSFLEGARQFARMAVETGFVRYEDFTDAPEKALTRICEGLEVEYDEKWVGTWQDNQNVTGDVHGGRAADGIESLPRIDAAEGYERAFLERAEVREILSMLGYEG